MILSGLENVPLPPKHKHILFHAYVWDPPMNIDASDEWMIALVENIGMILEAGPITAYNEDVGYRGITTTCLIRTSHIAMHVWDEMKPAMVQLDVYSCQDFEKDDVVEMLNQFRPYSIQWMKIDREHGLMNIGSGNE